MSIEQPKNEGGDTGKKEVSHIRARNMMQIELTKRHCAGRSHSEMEEWLTQTLSPKFRSLVNRRPELLALYEKNREAALAEAEKELRLKRGPAEH